MLFRLFFIKLITSAIILALTSFFTPNFEITNIFSLIIAAFIIMLIDYLFSILLIKNKNDFISRLVSFCVSIVGLYCTQFFVANYTISLPSAIIGATIYSLISSNITKKASQDSTTS